jgi:hypothetical protein
VADRLADRLARGLAQDLEIEPSQVGEPRRFLAIVARAFEERHQYDEAAPLA